MEYAELTSFNLSGDALLEPLDVLIIRRKRRCELLVFHGLARARVKPPLTFHVSVCERNGRTSVMATGRQVGPADTESFRLGSNRAEPVGANPGTAFIAARLVFT